MGVLRWIIGFLITVCIAMFAVLNRTDVSVSWNPIEAETTIILPLYLVALVAMAAGFVLGGIVVWFNMGRVRKEKRKQKRELKILEKEVGRLKDGKFSVTPPASDIFPALPAK